MAKKVPAVSAVMSRGIILLLSWHCSFSVRLLPLSIAQKFSEGIALHKWRWRGGRGCSIDVPLIKERKNLYERYNRKLLKRWYLYYEISAIILLSDCIFFSPFHVSMIDWLENFFQNGAFCYETTWYAGVQ